MTDLSKIQPAQRILPALEGQHIIKKKKDERRGKKDHKTHQDSDKERKVDEYI